MQNSPWAARRLLEDKHRRDDQRSPFQRDRARILHSAAFRRLQAKTQVLGVGLNDFYRTRLTHSLETAQIGTGIRAQLKAKCPQVADIIGPSSLIESLCLAHDIGHPPFGHGGEIALNYMMRHHCGFEGNGQTFRILTRLEPYTEQHGMNLCRRTLLGVLKYPLLNSMISPTYPTDDDHATQHSIRPADWPPVKAIYPDDSDILQWVLSPLSDNDKTRFCAFTPAKGKLPGRSCCKSFDATIMELADDIAYAVHDLEDAIVMGIVTQAQWQEEVAAPLADIDDPWIQLELCNIGSALFSPAHYLRKDAIGTMVNGFVTAIGVEKQAEFDSALLAYQARLQPAFAQALAILKAFVFRQVIRKPEVQMLEYKGQQMLMQLFEAFASDPLRLLPRNTQTRYQEALANGRNAQRVIADYLAGMTDDFATRTYQQLFTPAIGTVMDLRAHD
ncbi:deoxyguanosinetriphosphate triphosphohydrolase-like protein [Shewanella sp. NFH-SH190041]|uniref:anti-phage deoxyguanosine triphosphatase n=1 Tax=Shewanella sp. NFH-SH190041 TaxID=2950245 RepID=UPI0021C2E19F|nr:anti-phage deoxyguanosine triphosphatase [Shewanella sp. NFH-SH190041]BDM64138.1 deoxyguanosinetriphosphate triphosphohydrolase-like protein [Shewanella sp. NFH-SH190041]